MTEMRVSLRVERLSWRVFFMHYSYEHYAELTDLSKTERRRTLPTRNSDV